LGFYEIMVGTSFILIIVLQILASTLCLKKNVTLFTATCFSNVAVMGSLDVRPSVCPSVRDVGEQ